MLEMMCEDPSSEKWSKRQALAKTYMNKKARAWLNWICSRWIPVTQKTILIEDCVFLIYALMSSIYVNIREVMRSHMARTCKNM